MAKRSDKGSTGSKAEDFAAECVLSRLGKVGELVRGGAAETEKGLV